MVIIVRVMMDHKRSDLAFRLGQDISICEPASKIIQNTNNTAIIIQSHRGGWFGGAMTNN
jgi:hypothetical protein